MSILDGKLNHPATWWSITGPDGFGGDKFAQPVLIDTRWEDIQVKFVGRVDHAEKVSNAVVYVDRDMAEGDYLCLGDQTASVNPSAVVGAYKIERFDKTSDLRNVDNVRRAVL